MTITLLYFKLWKKKCKVDRLVEEDAVVEELVDVVMVDVNRDKELDGLKDAAVGGGRGGAADRGEHGHGRGCRHERGRVSNVDRQRIVDAFENGDDYH